MRFAVRHTTVGAEMQLMRAFVERLDRLLPDRDFAVFIEPRLPIGYPDCVLVEYDPAGFASWTRRRHVLSDREKKVLSALPNTRGLSASTVGRKIAVSTSVAERILRNLVQNGDARCRDGRHYCAVRDGVWGVRRIVSVEAKIGGFERVIDQATINRTFSNESYILMPERKLSPANCLALTDSRVGMYVLASDGRVRTVRRSPRQRSSSSYLPHFFNEWIGWRLLSERNRHGN